RGQVVARAPRADRPRDGRLLRPRLEGDADARAREPHPGADQALRGLADRPALLHDARRPGAAALWPRAARLPLPGPGRGDRVSLRRRDYRLEAVRLGDDLALDLRGPAVDRGDERGADVPLHVVLRRVAGAAHHLHALARD